MYAPHMYVSDLGFLSLIIKINLKILILFMIMVLWFLYYFKIGVHK